MIEFQEERLSDVKAEALPLLHEHWKEVALDQENTPLAPDWDFYRKVEEAGMFHVTTARKDRRLVGYSAYFLTRNPHYGILIADTDIFWLAPEERKGMTGVRLMKVAESQLIAKGVRKIASKVKLHIDVGKVFERLGYRPIERVYMKTVG